MLIEDLTSEDWKVLKGTLDQEERDACDRALTMGFIYTDEDRALTMNFIYTDEDRAIYENLKEPARSSIKSAFHMIAIKKSFEIPFEKLPQHLNSGNFVNQALCRFRLSRGF